MPTPSHSTNGRIPIKAAVVGAGRIAAQHFEFFETTEDASLCGVCDLSPSLGRLATERWGAAATYRDYDEMLAKVAPEVVHICTPAHTHGFLARKALDAGAHVICEKPIAPTNAEFLELAELARQKGRQLVEDHNYRFTEQFLRLEAIIADGTVGEVKEVEVRMVLDIVSDGARYADENLRHPSHDLPAGILHEFLPHLAYLALRFLPRVDSVRANWSKYSQREFVEFDDLDALVCGGGVHARLRFTAHQSPDVFSVVVRGDRGIVETEFFRPYYRLTKPRFGGDKVGHFVNHACNGVEFLRAAVVGLKDKVMQRSAYDGLRHFLALAYEGFRGGEAPVTFQDVNASTSLIDALLEARKRG